MIFRLHLEDRNIFIFVAFFITFFSKKLNHGRVFSNSEV